MDGESTAAALGAESAMLLGKLVEEKATQQGSAFLLRSPIRGPSARNS
jgi:hypothetical protein